MLGFILMPIIVYIVKIVFFEKNATKKREITQIKCWIELSSLVNRLGSTLSTSILSIKLIASKSRAKNEKIGALGLNFILNKQYMYLYFRTRKHYSKKGSRWSAYEVKPEKSYAVGMNRKVILERDDPM